MSPSGKKKPAASARDRLLALAREQGEDFQLVLTRYGLERLLYRLSHSPHHDRFVLKGAMLFILWSRNPHRPTRDVDFLGFGDSSEAGLLAVFRDLCAMPDQGDGVTFDPESVRVEPIRDDTEYGGMRVTLTGQLAGARIPIQADIGFGDAVTPETVVIGYPTLLDDPAPTLRAYPRETVIAEKYQALVALGMANSRMKDFYDLWVMARDFDYQGDTHAQATGNTFARRRTELPEGTPSGLGPDIAGVSRRISSGRHSCRDCPRTVAGRCFRTCASAWQSFCDHRQKQPERPCTGSFGPTPCSRWRLGSVFHRATWHGSVPCSTCPGLHVAIGQSWLLAKHPSSQPCQSHVPAATCSSGRVMAHHPGAHGRCRNRRTRYVAGHINTRQPLPDRHPLTTDAKSHFEAGRLSYSAGYLKPAKRLLIDLAVTKTALDKALSFANQLFLALEARGHRVPIAPNSERFRRAEVDEREHTEKHHHYNNLWSPQRCTVVYIGTVAIGLTIIELSENVEARYVNGEYVSLSDYVPKRRDRYVADRGWTSTHDFPTGRLCLQAYSPYPRAQWTRQWRETKKRDLSTRIPAIVRELTKATVDIARMVEEGERQAELERQRWAAQMEQWEREEAERRAAEALKDSKEELLEIIEMWATSKRLEEFFADAERKLKTLPEDQRVRTMERLQRARKLIGNTDALERFQSWKAPEER